MTFNTFINQVDALSWHEPRWLLLTALPIFIYWLRTIVRQTKTQYAEAHLMPWVAVQQRTHLRKRLISKNSAYLLAWLLIGIAAAGPRLPLQLATMEQVTNLDIMLVVDVSRSMQATDIQPSRLRRAQIEIEELLSRAKGKRIGIIVFAARPHLLSPPTSDMSALRFYLRTLNSLTLPTTGSNPITALAFAQKELRNSINPTAIILLSDGDFPTTMEIAGSQKSKIPLFILGIGSKEGAGIPLKNGQWLAHEGQPVVSRLNEKSLRNLIAQNDNTGIGSNIDKHYSRVRKDDSDWQKLYDNGISQLGTRLEETDADHKIIWQQLYHWPLFIAILLLLISLLPFGLPLRTRSVTQEGTNKGRSVHTTRSVISTANKALVIFFGIVLLMIYPYQPVSASTLMADNVNVMQAYKHYTNKNYPAAIAIYQRLSGYAARFGEASSLYKTTDYSGAIRQFSLAVLAASNDQQRATVLFNLGNSYFQTGNYAAAITSYADVLKYQSANKNTLHNLKFSRALKKAVDERLQKIKKRSARMGRGPQSAPSEESINSNQSGSLAIDEGSDSKKDIPLPELADLSSDALERLIKKGLAQIQLADNTTGTKSSETFQHNQLAFINARVRMSELEDQQDLLWKHLFEMEEGFPAPLAEPRQVPGVSPW